MKKFISILLLLLFIGSSVQAATLQSAIAKYKQENYTGCLNDLFDVIDDMAEDKDTQDVYKKIILIASKYDSNKLKDPKSKETEKFLEEFYKIVDKNKAQTDKMAYIYYYIALCMHQTMLVDRTKESISTMYLIAYVFSPNSKIGEFSMKAIECIDNPNSCPNTDMDEFIRSGKQVSDEIVKDQLEKNLQKHKDEINQGKDLSYVDNLDRIEVSDINTLTTENMNNENMLAWGFLGKKQTRSGWVDAGVPEINESYYTEKPANGNNNSMPTDEEIGKAVRTLQRAGISPATYGAYMNTNPNYNAYNNEYAQIQALLNDGNDYYPNDYSTYMMMNNQNGQQMSPELMQIIMRQQMMNGYGF